MAKAIAPTPTLKGKDTKSFLEEMKMPNNRKENQIKQRINNVGMLISFRFFTFHSFFFNSSDLGGFVRNLSGFLEVNKAQHCKNQH